MESDNYNIHDEDSYMVNEPLHWGGQWTEDKLDAFAKYVNAYLTIMNAFRDKYKWRLIYFDGFAGSGSRSDKNKENDSVLLQDLFKDTLIQKEELNLYKGAAERVLSIPKRGFDLYYFIDKDEESSANLKKLLSKFESEKTMIFRNSDANKQIEMLVQAMHKDKKLVSLVLLDPFGMQVDWKSIEMLKGTHTDLWILIPTGVIVNRLLDRRGNLAHITKLSSFFGKDEDFLRSYFYSTKQDQTLFGETEIIRKVEQPIQKIAELYILRLKEIFKHVTENPLVLYNTQHTPLFHFACASNNQNAIKIASQIINKQQKR